MSADKIDLARSLLTRAGGKLRLPIDSVCAAKIEPGVDTQVASGAISADLMGLDIGPATIKLYRDLIAPAKTIIWNGPMGVFETPPFDKGTVAVAEAMAAATATGATTIIARGDSAAAVDQGGPGREDDAHLDRRRREPGVPRRQTVCND